MFTVHILRNLSRVPVPVAVVTPQAGGCTRSELPRENERKARSAAARKHGGNPLDWRVVRLAGRWDTREAAQTIADHLNGEDASS